MKGKGNDGTGNTSERDLWETPNWLFNILNEQYKFTFDCCANETNSKCKFYSNNLSEVIFDPKHTLWMNPPFSNAKDMFKLFFNSNCKGIAIYRCDNMETKTWQDIIFNHADWVFIPKGRVYYFLATEFANGRKGSRFPSALIGVGLNIPNKLDGIVLYLKRGLTK